MASNASNATARLGRDEASLYVVGGENVVLVMNVIDNFGQVYPLGSYFSEGVLKQLVDARETSVHLQLQCADERVKLSLSNYSYDLVNDAIVVTGL